MALVATASFVGKGVSRRVAAQMPVAPPPKRPIATGMAWIASEMPRNAARNGLGGTAIPVWQREMRFVTTAMLMAHTRERGIAAQTARVATETPESATERPRGGK
jgi:hypothetical protein